MEALFFNSNSYKQYLFLEDQEGGVEMNNERLSPRRRDSEAAGPPEFNSGLPDQFLICIFPGIEPRT